MGNTGSYNTTLLSALSRSLGKAAIKALEDDNVIELMLNPDGKLWIDRLGNPIMECIEEIPPVQGKQVVKTMATSLNSVLDDKNPIIEGELALDGSRLEGLLPPIVAGPTFAIRKKASMVFSLDEYRGNSILPAEFNLNATNGANQNGNGENLSSIFGGSTQIDSLSFFQQAIAKHLNILVVGGTGSGKTTFVNALGDTLSAVAPNDRLIIIQDTLEIQSKSANAVFLRTSDYVDIRRLVRASMRLRPDRILIGEVRDGAALDLLKAWNTGHPGGIATVHANSAYEGLLRMEELIAEVSVNPKHRLIGNAIDIIVFIEKHKGDRRISEIVLVNGYDPIKKEYDLEYCLNRGMVFEKE